MTVTPTASTKKAWSTLVTQPAQEFPITPLSVIDGQIPAGLQGTLYRNGPGRLSLGGETVGHWFDGDGAILAVNFRNQEAMATYRFVQTAGYQAETAANRHLFGNYGMTDPQGLFHFWRNLWQKESIFKNAANTSVLALPDRLLALWEGGAPHALDLETLETLGKDNLAGALGADEAFSAHPLRAPLSGEIYNTGVDLQRNLLLCRLNGAGQVLKRNRIPAIQAPFCHSFCLAGPYLIFFFPPVTLAQLPLLFGMQSYDQALGWNAEGCTKILVVDRESLTVVSEGETEAWFQWHFGNGCVLPDGTVRLDFVHFPDFVQTNTYLREVATGITQTPTDGHLWQVILDPKTAKVLSATPVVERYCEFPVVDPRQTGQPWSRTYLAIQRQGVEPGTELFGALACYDYQTESLTEFDLGENCYGMEPLLIPDLTEAEKGWLITVVYDGNCQESQVWIWDAGQLAEAPLCKLALPHPIPYGFHGTWKAGSA